MKAPIKLLTTPCCSPPAFQIPLESIALTSKQRVNDTRQDEGPLSEGSNERLLDR